MRRSIGTLLVGFLLILASDSTAAAQAGAREIGVDARASYFNPDEDFIDGAFRLQVPVGLVRMGFMLSDRVSLEPAVALLIASSDGETGSQLDLMINLLAHNRPLTEGPVYFGGGVGITRFSGGGDAASAFSLAARAGIKPNISDVLLGRLGAFVERQFENDNFSGMTEFGAEFGISVLLP